LSISQLFHTGTTDILGRCHHPILCMQPFIAIEVYTASIPYLRQITEDISTLIQPDSNITLHHLDGIG
jgi:hypothetical protein